MKFELPKLPYSYDALEPYIDARTMEIHHTKHHQTYVDKLNAALEKHPHLLEERIQRREEGGENGSDTMTLEILLSDLSSIPENIRGAVRNHGGGHLNHSFFWRTMCPLTLSQSKGGPAGALAKAINNSFGDYQKFKDEFSKAAAGIFGSGWAWLIKRQATGDKGQGLVIITTANQDSPISQGFRPILGLDVWEHAYYLKYQNKRPEYIENWWQVVNWEQVENNLKNADL